MKTMKHLLTLILLLIAVPACNTKRTQITGDPLVLTGTQPSNLLHAPVDTSRGVTVRSTYLTTPKTITYEEGVDYTLNPAAGTLARTPVSRIPNYATNSLFNQKNFNHSAFPGYGNLPHTIYVSYSSPAKPVTVEPVDVSSLLPKTAQKLRSHQPLKLIAYGDSITAGGDASSVDLQYPSLYANHLRTRFPQSPITFENGATGGDTTRNGLARLNEKVLSRSPDLVLVAFGMNDHNVPAGGGVPLDEFERNLVQIVSDIRAKTGAECILLSCFPPNDDWAFGTHNMAAYAQATRRAATQTNAPFIDVYALWQKVLTRKDPRSLLANNINHPNDFGHHLYLLALQSLKF